MLYRMYCSILLDCHTISNAVCRSNLALQLFGGDLGMYLTVYQVAPVGTLAQPR